MKPRLERFGQAQNPVVVVDNFSGGVAAAVELASALAPFAHAPAGNYYPGLRRVITPGDPAAYAYVEQSLEGAAPFIGGGFDLERFDLVEASFSMVTDPPERLSAAQRAPHFDATDPKYLAVLLYLSDTPGSGTAFFRQRSTGIETVTEANLARFVATARAEAADPEASPGYVQGSNRHFEQLGLVEAVPDRLVIYRGGMLHSGIIPPAMSFSPDPREGRLTLNIFVRGH